MAQLLRCTISVVSAHVAQSVEHILGKDEVTGSIPVMGSIRVMRYGPMRKEHQFS